MELKVTRIYSQLKELSVLNSHWGWVKVEEGIGRRGLMPVLPPVSPVLVGLWGSSITGFLIKKFPARKIKLNRQYKHNEKSILQLTFLLYIIEQLDFRLIQLCKHTQLLRVSDWSWGEGEELQRKSPLLQIIFIRKMLLPII